MKSFPIVVPALATGWLFAGLAYAAGSQDGSENSPPYRHHPPSSSTSWRFQQHQTDVAEPWNGTLHPTMYGHGHNDEHNYVPQYQTYDQYHGGLSSSYQPSAPYENMQHFTDAHTGYGHQDPELVSHLFGQNLQLGHQPVQDYDQAAYWSMYAPAMGSSGQLEQHYSQDLPTQQKSNRRLLNRKGLRQLVHNADPDSLRAFLTGGNDAHLKGSAPPHGQGASHSQAIEVSEDTSDDDGDHVQPGFHDHAQYSHMHGHNGAQPFQEPQPYGHMHIGSSSIHHHGPSETPVLPKDKGVAISQEGGDGGGYSDDQRPVPHDFVSSRKPWTRGPGSVTNFLNWSDEDKLWWQAFNRMIYQKLKGVADRAAAGHSTINDILASPDYVGELRYMLPKVWIRNAVDNPCGLLEDRGTFADPERHLKVLQWVNEERGKLAGKRKTRPLKYVEWSPTEQKWVMKQEVLFGQQRVEGPPQWWDSRHVLEDPIEVERMRQETERGRKRTRAAIRKKAREEQAIEYYNRAMQRKSQRQSNIASPGHDSSESDF